MVDVFISYPRAAREQVEPIKARLEAEGFSVFFDVQGIDGGAEFPAVIDRAVKSAKVVLGCWSEHAFSRPWVMRECRVGQMRGVLVPVAIEKFDDLSVPTEFSGIHYIDLTEIDGPKGSQSWDHVLRVLWRHVGEESRPSNATADIVQVTPPSGAENGQAGDKDEAPPPTGFFGGIKANMMNAARSPNAERALFVVSFAESSFFPLPPDLMLGPMAAAEPTKWLRYAIICTIASVLGGLAGYAIGMFLMDQVGRYILDFFGYSNGREQELRAFYDQYGAWFIFLKGLTPIPYKLVTILSGALHFSIPIFIAASIVTRGLRFALVAWIFQKFGPQIAPVMEKRMGLVLIVVAVVIVAMVLALRFIPH